MCGIFGHAGSSPKKVNIDKLNLLGVWNETRGTDSCGLSVDGDILKGVKSLSQYRDFIAYYGIEGPQVLPTIIGHTRKSTVGAHTLSNAHPFGFGKHKIKGIKNVGFEFIGVHNGTLINHKQLAIARKISLEKKAKFKLTTKVPNGEDIIEIEEKDVIKIDSELLLECIYKDGNFDVLSEYNGAAALVWTNTKKPNVAYFYHGNSAKIEGDKDTEEERPLYYWQENQNSLYVSSIVDSLYAIGGDGDTVDMFDYNTVYEVTNGNIKTAKKYKVNREGKFQKESYYYNNKMNHSKRNFQPATSPTDTKKTISSQSRGILGKAYYPKLGSAEQIKLNLEIPVDTGLLNEEFDKEQSLAKGLTMMKQLRYFRNGHKCSGVFGYVAGFGFYFLGNTKAAAAKSLQHWAGRLFSKGQFRTEDISSVSNDAWIPFPKKLVEKNVSSFLHYMHEGIRYKSHIDWKNVINDSATVKRFGVLELSMAAAHPIIDLNNSRNRVAGAYYKGELFTGITNPLGSSKKYKFRYGQIQNISFVPNCVPKALTNDNTHVYSLNAATAFLEKSCKDEEPKNKKDVKNLNEIIDDLEKEEQNLLNTILLENFNENFDKFPTVLRDLRKLKKNSKKAAIAYQTIQEFLNGCSKIVAIDMEEERKTKKKSNKL